MAIPRLRDYQGPAIFSYGFRPFFLFGATFAGLAIPLWLCAFQGEIELPTAFAPRDWHVHEMLFGFVAAIIGGFLLTAVPNWTGRLPLQGTPLAVLVSSWLAGRIAVFMSASIGWALACVIDAAFLALLAAAAAREIIAGRKWNNLPVVAIVSLFGAANIAFHLEAHFNGLADYSTRFAIALVIMLVSLIGGRIVPSFTRNWLARQGQGRLPARLDRFDMAAIGVCAAALVVWVVVPQSPAAGILLLAAAAAQAARLARWAGERTWREPLVLVLHVGYAFVPVGALILGLSTLGVAGLPQSGALHAWTTGAIGVMTLAVMTRATLGHTGRDLRATLPTLLIYGAVLVAAATRIAAPLVPSLYPELLILAAVGWIVAFGTFVLVYGPMLVSAKQA